MHTLVYSGPLSVCQESLLGRYYVTTHFVFQLRGHDTIMGPLKMYTHFTFRISTVAQWSFLFYVLY